MNEIVSWVLVVLLIVFGIGVVIITATPVLNRAESSLELQNAENTLLSLTKAIDTVKDEGNGSSRVVNIPKGTWELSNNVIRYIITEDVMEAGTRDVGPEIEVISGSDAHCREDGNIWIMDNALLTVKLKNDNSTFTSSNIVELMLKSSNLTIAPQDSSIIINGVAGTASGTGFSEIHDNNGARCTIRYHMNSISRISYDIFYTLYAGADFLVVEVENVVEIS